MVGAYPKILHIGDRPIADLFDGEVEITEKVDGSQFGFGKQDGVLIARSKGKELDLDNPDKMFALGVEYIKTIAHKIPDNTFFYGEYLEKPRHSTLAYNRIPTNHISLFGVLLHDRTMEDYDGIAYWADRLGIDAIPLLYKGESSPQEIIEIVKNTESYLGGQNIEGVVVKRYEPWLFMSQILYPVKAGKYVTDKFKEVHSKDWAKLNTSKGAFEVIKQKYKTQARWDKAIMHLKESNEFTGTVKDIGKLVKEIQNDLTEEEKENIKIDLWKVYGPDVIKNSTNGFVDWYKEQIVLGVFQDETIDA